MDPPPPAYSEQQEFDQKVSQVTSLSLQDSQEFLSVDSDGFPPYDPTAFEATSIESSSTSPSTTERSSSYPMESSSGKKDDYMHHGRTDDMPSVVPLRIEKKRQAKTLPDPPNTRTGGSSLTIGDNSTPTLSETSYYGDFKTQPRTGSSSLTIGDNSTPTLSETSNYGDFKTQLSSSSTIGENSTFKTQQRTYVEDAVPLTPVQHSYKKDASLSSMPSPPFEDQPPPFIPESRPLVYDYDNPYQQYVDPPHNISPSQHAHQRDASPSLPSPPFEDQPPTFISESRPLVYDYDNPYQQYVDPPYNISPSQSARQFQSRSRLVLQEPALSSPNNPRTSYLDFNPSIAYRRTLPAAPSLPLKQPVENIQFDPHSLYNSAVSAQITPITTGQQGHSYNSRNSFNPQRQHQQQGSSATYVRPGGHYSQSYASRDPPSTQRSSASFELNSSRRPVLQSPARPPSSSSMSSNYQMFSSPTAVYPGNIFYDQSLENRWSTQ